MIVKIHLTALKYEELFQWAKSPKKRSEGVRFINSVLKIQCHIVKNTLLDFAHWDFFADNVITL